MIQASAIAPGRRVGHVALTHDQVVMRFAGVQFFSQIYLQKFALFPLSFALSIPMLIMFISIAWMVLMKHLTIQPKRLAAFLTFIGCCLFSEAYMLGSVTSLVLLVVLYGCLTVSAEVSEETYQRIFKMFINYMIVPAIIVIVQYGYQVLTHRTDPISMNAVVSPQLLLHGYNYDGHFPWNSYFVRPQGFFFLEPSFVSAFTSAAVVIEITYFRRWQIVLLMMVATFLSHGDTGVAVLLGASPFLLAREKPVVIVGMVAAGVLAISVALALQVSLPLLSRTSQLDSERSSAHSRIVMPAQTFARSIFNPSYFFLGDGAGDMTTAQERADRSDPNALQKEYNGITPMSSPWPIVKVLKEYGLLSMIAFVCFYVIGIRGRFNVPLKVGLSLVYFFTGGYLLSTPMVGMVACLCFMFAPRHD